MRLCFGQWWAFVWTAVFADVEHRGKSGCNTKEKEKELIPAAVAAHVFYIGIKVSNIFKTICFP